MRLYEFSKKHNLANKEIIAILQKNGFDVATHMALLPQAALEFLENYIKQSQSPVEQSSVKKSEISPEKKSSADTSRVADASRKMETQVIKDKIKIEPKAEQAVILRPMTVGDLSLQLQKPVNDIILTLLRQGVVAAKNQVISEKLVAQLAQYYGIKTKQDQLQQSATMVGPAKANGKDARPPVVCVIGHVDHGKTSLLDFIRKTRVAAREKGGITQHIGAYEAQTEQGPITFLDTPGHEAFSMIRVRGVRVADIAILVVAADDGIMPQTLEAIRVAKSAGLPVIVAINKIDKATPSQIEAVKRGLAQHDLVPEEWGGQTVCMPISAKLGTGITELLDMVILQAQLMELTTDMQAPVRGYVLESRIEKGRGPVATVICQQGILQIGDPFVCGPIKGKVTSMVDFQGKRIVKAFPSQPVSVAGFSELPNTGELFSVVSLQEYKQFVPQLNEPTKVQRQSSTQDSLPIIIKTDTLSSREALLQAIAKMSGKYFKQIHILSAQIGAISDSDVLLAHDTGAIIYGLHAKTESSAIALAQKHKVAIKTFDIIYKMLEELEQISELGRPVKKVLKKIGEATVLKVFDIKDLGVIAGAQVKSGRFSRDGKVVVWRGKFKVGEGSIKSLQRDRKSVKEVHSGFECAFMVDGFTEWQPDDRVECMLEVEEAE